jgi:hypothetical protein
VNPVRIHVLSDQSQDDLTATDADRLEIFRFLRRDHSVDGISVAAPGLADLLDLVFVRLDFELLTQNDIEAKVIDEHLIEALEVVLRVQIGHAGDNPPPMAAGQPDVIRKLPRLLRGRTSRARRCPAAVAGVTPSRAPRLLTERYQMIARRPAGQDSCVG